MLEEQKQILKRTTEVDLTQPAVKRKTPEEKEASESGSELDIELDSGSEKAKLNKPESKQDKSAEEKSQSS